MFVVGIGNLLVITISMHKIDSGRQSSLDTSFWWSAASAIRKGYMTVFIKRKAQRKLEIINYIIENKFYISIPRIVNLYVIFHMLPFFLCPSTLATPA